MKSITSVRSNLITSCLFSILYILLSGIRTTDATSYDKIWKKITFFAQSGSSMVDETMDNNKNTDLNTVEPSSVNSGFSCPSMQPDFFCDQEWAPVLCDNLCQYGNACEANASGYNTDTQCEAVVTEDFVCPTMDPEAICYEIYQPVTCGAEKCVYSNDCIAISSGYNFEIDCVYN
jgi:hypothetical protein